MNLFRPTAPVSDPDPPRAVAVTTASRSLPADGDVIGIFVLPWST